MSASRPPSAAPLSCERWQSVGRGLAPTLARSQSVRGSADVVTRLFISSLCDLLALSSLRDFLGTFVLGRRSSHCRCGVTLPARAGRRLPGSPRLLR